MQIETSQNRRLRLRRFFVRKGSAFPGSFYIGRRSPRMRATRIKPRVKRASFASETLGQREGSHKPTEWAPDSATEFFNARFRSPAPRVPLPFNHDTQGSAARLVALRRSASHWALFESPAFAGLTVRNRPAECQIPGRGYASRGKALPFRPTAPRRGCASPARRSLAEETRTWKDRAFPHKQAAEPQGRPNSSRHRREQGAAS
jgi:hypothetical protein